MRHDDLDELLDHVWTYLQSAATDPSHPGRMPTFCSDGPDARTVVVRHADRDERRMAFHTDTRSAKLDQLRRRPKVAWHHWNGDLKQQFRLYGRADLHLDDELADEIWKAQGEEGRSHYQKGEAPGTVVETPRSGHPGRDGDAEEVEDPRQYFGVVSTVVDRIDWLHLHPEGHYRAEFEWTSQGFRGTWIVP